MYILQTMSLAIGTFFLGIAAIFLALMEALTGVSDDESQA